MNSSIKRLDKTKIFKPYFAMIFFVAGVVAAACFYSVPSAVAKTDNLLTVPGNFTELASMASPAVVNIRTVKIVRDGGHVFRHFSPGPFGRENPFNDFFEKFFGGDRQREFKQQSLGSGFIIDHEGYIVTNNHVVANADDIKVKLKDEREFEAKVIGRDPSTDLALIKIKSDKKLPVVQLGDSDTLEIGQWVVAIGSPFGLEHTVTAGIVSAKGRVIGSGPYDNFIQTDASINPGNSGGPLISMQGKVVGINTAIVAGGHGIGFAIPINLAKGILDQLKNSGEVTRGWLGVGIQNLSRELSEYYGMEDKKGVLVTEVFPGDPASEAGIEPEDIILEVNGKKIEASRDLTRMIANIGVGETTKITVLRNGKKKKFSVEIAKRKESAATSGENTGKQDDELGIRVSNLTADMIRQFNIKTSDGVIVVDIEPGSKGEQAGIRRGDIIKKINRKPVTNVREFANIIEKFKKDELIKMLVMRMNFGLFIVEITK